MQKELFSRSQLVSLIWPLVIEQLLAVGVGMADSTMISYAGEAAISGVSLVDMVNTFFIALFSALGTGGAVLVSQYIGKGDRQQGGMAAGQLSVLSVLFAAILAGGLIFLRAPVLKLLFGSIEADVMKNALTYFLLSCLSYPFLALYNSGAALFRAMGNSRISMIISILMNVVNCAGNALLIFGFDMGVAGAAIASLVSRALAAILIFRLLFRQHEIEFKAEYLLRWNGSIVRKLTELSLPVGIDGGIFQLGRVLVVSIIATFGTAQIAANAVANNLDYLGCIPGNAMCLAMITVVGRCLGAGRREEAKRYSLRLMGLSTLFSIVINGTILLLLRPLLGIYSISPQASELARKLVLIHNGCATLLWPMSFVLPNVLKAAGDVKYVMAVSVGSMILFRIVLSVVLGMWLGWGALGVWTGMIADWCCRLTLFLIRYFRGRWLELRVV